MSRSQTSTLELWKNHEGLRAECSANGVLQQRGPPPRFLASRNPRGEVVQAGCSGLCPRKQRQPVSGTEPVATTEACLLLQGPLFKKPPGLAILFPCLDSYPSPNSMPGLAPGSPWSMFGAPPLMCTYLGPKYGCRGHADLELRCGLRLPAKQLPYYFSCSPFASH